MWFVIGDYVAGAVVGAGTALAVHAIVQPGMDMVIAMLLGMAIGMVLHFVLGFILAPFLGMFQTMMPASLIGMYGGMAFGMRDSMGAGSVEWSSCTLVGIIFGIVVVFALHVYDRALRAVVVEGAD
jgi:hypothetical protein